MINALRGWKLNHRVVTIVSLKSNERILMRWPLVKRWVLLLGMWNWLSTCMTWTIEGLFHVRCDAVKTESNCWLIPRSCTSHLGVRLHIFLVVLKHRQVVGVCSVFKGTNDWLFDSKLFDRVRRVSGQTQLSHLRWVSVLRVWVIRGSSLLRAELIIAFNNYCAELERSIFIGGLNIYEESGPPRVIDAWFVVWGCLSLFGAAATWIMEDLKTSLACGTLLAVTQALLGGGLWLGSGHGLSLTLLLSLLVRKAFVVSRFKLLVETFDRWERDTGHHL